MSLAASAAAARVRPTVAPVTGDGLVFGSPAHMSVPEPDSQRLPTSPKFEDISFPRSLAGEVSARARAAMEADQFPVDIGPVEEPVAELAEVTPAPAMDDDNAIGVAIAPERGPVVRWRPAPVRSAAHSLRPAA